MKKVLCIIEILLTCGSLFRARGHVVRTTINFIGWIFDKYVYKRGGAVRIKLLERRIIWNFDHTSMIVDPSNAHFVRTRQMGDLTLAWKGFQAFHEDEVLNVSFVGIKHSLHAKNFLTIRRTNYLYVFPNQATPGVLVTYPAASSQQ
ncbi:MAG: hypothetical protein SFX74_12635 [Fimbriimonadaceae bacterium]|nr:hypothetical protein [Fimbriimonadaceae bacterium]